MAEIILVVLYLAPLASLFVGVVKFKYYVVMLGVHIIYSIKERNYDNEITLFTDVISIYIGSDCSFY